MGICIGIGNYIGKKSALSSIGQPPDNAILAENSSYMITNDRLFIQQEQQPLVYPGLVAAWSARGKRNTDYDKNILKDLTGNGHDIQLHNFNWNTKSGYDNATYPEALIFDGIDDYGINESMPVLNDYTIIVKRVRLGGQWVASKAFNNSVWGAFIFEDSRGCYSYNRYNPIIPSKDSIVYGTTTSYNGQSIKKGSSVDGPVLTLGCLTNKEEFYKGAIYSVYLFDRTLPDQEIKSFIRTYIDSEYLLPSEKHLILDVGKLDYNTLK